MTVSQIDLEKSMDKLKAELTGDPSFDLEHRTKREAERENAHVRKKAVLAEIRAIDLARLAAWGECNAALIQFRDCLASVKSLTADEAALWGKLDQVPVVLQISDVAQNLGGGVVQEIGTIPGHRAGFGPVSFSGTSTMKPGTDWKARETNRIKPFMQLLENRYGR